MCVCKTSELEFSFKLIFPSDAMREKSENHRAISLIHTSFIVCRGNKSVKTLTTKSLDVYTKRKKSKYFCFRLDLFQNRLGVQESKWRSQNIFLIVEMTESLPSFPLNMKREL